MRCYNDGPWELSRRRVGDLRSGENVAIGRLFVAPKQTGLEDGECEEMTRQWSRVVMISRKNKRRDEIDSQSSGSSNLCSVKRDQTDSGAKSSSSNAGSKQLHRFIP